MLIICEDCAKRYNIDESRIKGNRARFSCKECGHIIIVEKSDFTRPLISKSSVSQDKSGTIELFREMDESAESDIFSGSTVESETGKTGRNILGAGKSAPVALYFILAFIAAFLCVSGVVTYLYLADIAPIIERSGGQSGFLVKALSLLAAAWTVVFAVFYLLASVLARPINTLKESIVRRLRGEEVTEDSFCGPREIRELASILFRITGNRS